MKSTYQLTKERTTPVIQTFSLSLAVGLFALYSQQAFAISSWCNNGEDPWLPQDWNPLCDLPALGPECRFLPEALNQCRNDMLVCADPNDPKCKGDVPDHAWFPVARQNTAFRCKCLTRILM